jgi:hypothetical protein
MEALHPNLWVKTISIFWFFTERRKKRHVIVYFSIFVTEVQIKIEIHKSIIETKTAGNSTGGYAPRYPQPTACLVKKVLEHIHIQI